MRGFNRAIIAGNLTKDPELRYTVNKKAFARFTVAVNNRFRNANGETQDSTDYINVVAWNATAETCGKYLKKGSPVLVEGRIRTGSYDAKDGSGKRYTTEIWVDNLIMLGSGQGSGQGSSSWADSSSSEPPLRYPNSSDGYPQMPPLDDSDSDFGKSIGESGFGDGFASGKSVPDADIPF